VLRTGIIKESRDLTEKGLEEIRLIKDGMNKQNHYVVGWLRLPPSLSIDPEAVGPDPILELLVCFKKLGDTPKSPFSTLLSPDIRASLDRLDIGE
jgi:hypothetical protein